MNRSILPKVGGGHEQAVVGQGGGETQHYYQSRVDDLHVLERVGEGMLSLQTGSGLGASTAAWVVVGGGGTATTVLWS